MTTYNGRAFDMIGVHRTWFDSAQEAFERKGIYGKISTDSYEIGQVWDWMDMGDAVAEASWGRNYEEEVVYCVRFADDGTWQTVEDRELLK